MKSAVTRDCQLSGLRSNLHYVKRTKVYPCVPGTAPQCTVCSSEYLSHFCHRVNLLSGDNLLMLLWMGKRQRCSLRSQNKKPQTVPMSQWLVRAIFRVYLDVCVHHLPTTLTVLKHAYWFWKSFICRQFDYFSHHYLQAQKSLCSD